MRKILFICLFLLSISVVAQDDTMTITIINTADEHGWLQPFESEGGVASIQWDEDALILSGGDNWTGPAISTWFEGEPVVQAMNQLGYAASAIGNHEFDFGRDVMQQRFDEAEFPYLAANIRIAETDELLAQPYALFDVHGVQVGVIGLTTQATVGSTHPRNINDLIFTDYQDALEEFVPRMREEGAQIIIGLTHVCANELITLTDSSLVDAFFSGHCNETFNEVINGVSIMGGGANWRSYAQLELTFDGDSIINMQQDIVSIRYDPINTKLVELINFWQEKVDEELSRIIGYTSDGIDQRSHFQANWVTDSWLWAYPQADVAITNWGGLRQSISPGAITINDIVGVLPFDNTLYVVEITGDELIDNLACCGGAVSGINYRGGQIIMTDGTDFDPDAMYTIIINDFMYFGGDDYSFGEHDAYDTGINWRQPVIDYTESLELSEDNPLENYVDNEARG